MVFKKPLFRGFGGGRRASGPGVSVVGRWVVRLGLVVHGESRVRGKVFSMSVGCSGSGDVCYELVFMNGRFIVKVSCCGVYVF